MVLQPFLHRSLVGGLVMIAAVCACASPPPSISPAAPAPAPSTQHAPAVAQAVNATDAFARLQALVGDWETSTSSGAPLKVSYRLLASDSALVETFGAASQKQTLTIFHVDASRLIATHYCAQGNQPRLRLEPAAAPEHFAFSFFDATNLPDPRRSHLRHLRIDRKDRDHFERTETYQKNGKDDVTVLSFSRVQ